jgi:hypothetical protein
MTVVIMLTLRSGVAEKSWTAHAVRHGGDRVLELANQHFADPVEGEKL